MKISALIMFFTMVLISCDDRDVNNPNFNNVEFSAKNFVGSKVAFERNGEIELGIHGEELLNSFNNYSQKTRYGLKSNFFSDRRN